MTIKNQCQNHRFSLSPIKKKLLKLIVITLQLWFPFIMKPRAQIKINIGPRTPFFLYIILKSCKIYFGLSFFFFKYDSFFREDVFILFNNCNWLRNFSSFYSLTHIRVQILYFICHILLTILSNIAKS